MQFDREAAGALRDEAVAIRDAILRAGDTNKAVTLSYIAAFMATAIQHMFD